MSMSDMKRFLMEPTHDNSAVDSFFGLGMETMGLSSTMDEFSHGFDFSFLPDYGGLDFCSTDQDVQAGLKFEILDGFLDEVEEVEDIYASHDLSSISNHILPETEVKKKVSESDGDSYGLMNFRSESYSPGISGSTGLSEWSKVTVPYAESQNVSSGKLQVSLDSNESEDNKKPLSTFIGSWAKRSKNRKKTLPNTAYRRLDSPCVSYGFRPRKGPMKRYMHTSTENTFPDDHLTTSESEDDICVTKKTSRTREDRRKHQRMWTVDEVMTLVDGISHFGVGKWTDIKNLYFPSATHRRPVDLRDKWRNLLKVSSNDKHNDGEAEERRKSLARPIPKDILNRVRELASRHPYPFSKSSCFVYDSSSSQSISKKKKKKKRS